MNQALVQPLSHWAQNTAWKQTMLIWLSDTDTGFDGSNNGFIISNSITIKIKWSKDTADIMIVVWTGLKLFLCALWNVAVISRSVEHQNKCCQNFYLNGKVREEREGLRDYTSQSNAGPQLDQPTLRELKRVWVGVQGSWVKRFIDGLLWSCCRLTLPLGGG